MAASNATAVVKLANNLNMAPSCLYVGGQRSGHGQEETCTAVSTLVLGCYIAARYVPGASSTVKLLRYVVGEPL